MESLAALDETTRTDCVLIGVHCACRKAKWCPKTVPPAIGVTAPSSCWSAHRANGSQRDRGGKAKGDDAAPIGFAERANDRRVAPRRQPSPHLVHLSGPHTSSATN